MSDNAEPMNLDISDEMIAERRGGGELPDDMPPWMAATIRTIDKFSLRIGQIV